MFRKYIWDKVVLIWEGILKKFNFMLWSDVIFIGVYICWGDMLMDFFGYDVVMFEYFLCVVMFF